MKKILASILLFAMTFCMFGCGGNEQGEKKLQTVDEIIAELDNQIGDYDEKGLKKWYDSFIKATYIEEKDEIVMNHIDEQLEEYEEFYAFKPIILNIEKDEEKEFVFTFNALYISLENSMTYANGIAVSDSENVIEFVSPSQFIDNDFGTCVVVGVLNITDQNIFENARNVANSKNNLIVRFKQEFNGLVIKDYTLTDEEDTRVKYMLNLYLDVAEKVDTSKIDIKATK